VALKQYRPTSPGRRGMSGSTFEEITKTKPEKSLLLPLKKKAGRSNQGRITVRHRGGGAKRRLRIIDFKRDKLGVPGRVAAIEYDPNRSARIALIYYADGEKRYILAPSGLSVGDVIKSGDDAEVKPGNALPLKLIPTGTLIHNIELEVGRGGQLVRSAGAAAQLVAKEGEYALVLMLKLKFYGKDKNVHAIMSEGMKKAFILSIWLANMKRANKNFKFVILDDITDSLDNHYRCRFIDLLDEEFSNVQKIILTHDNFLFQYCKNYLAGSLYEFMDIKKLVAYSKMGAFLPEF